jgi:restriction system protein
MSGNVTGSTLPDEQGFKYVQSRDEINTVPRSIKNIKERYARLIAMVALRTIHEVFAADQGLVEGVTFNGHVSTKDRATGQPVRPCLISVEAPLKLFATFVLPDLDAVACLHNKLTALISPHPYDLEAVVPVVDFEMLLSQYKFVDGMDAIAGLDSRRDLLAMTPTEFEHLVRQLFEKMGMKTWNTQASKDDGVDAVATNEEPIFRGLCIIQAKRYRGAVGVEAVRALAGVMEDKRATKGTMVTPSWLPKTAMTSSIAMAASRSWSANRSTTCAGNTSTWTSSSVCRSPHRNDGSRCSCRPCADALFLLGVEWAHRP